MSEQRTRLRGRPKGALNRLPVEVARTAITAARAAGERIDPAATDGLLAYLTWLALEQPGTFAGLLARMIPKHVRLNADSEPAIKVYSNVTDEMIFGSDGG